MSERREVNVTENAQTGTFQPGELVGARFVVQERLRTDFTGSVYRVLDGQSQRQVECLVLHALPEAKETLSTLREQVKRAKAFQGDAFVKLFGMGRQKRRLLYWI